jgi:hypothetical protein
MISGADRRQYLGRGDDWRRSSDRPKYVRSSMVLDSGMAERMVFTSGEDAQPKCTIVSMTGRKENLAGRASHLLVLARAITPVVIPDFRVFNPVQRELLLSGLRTAADEPEGDTRTGPSAGH